MKPHFFLSLCLFCVASEVFPQQEQVRRDLRTPGVVVENGAPNSKTWSLQFTASGNELLAAGNDKVVRQWAFSNGNLDLATAQIFRWAAYREQRGTIYCTALSHDPEQRLLAVAGLGLRTGSIAIIDRRTGEVLYGLKDRLSPQPFSSIAFLSSSNMVIYGSCDGCVGCWNYVEGTVSELGRHGKMELNTVWLVYSLDLDRFISIAWDGSVHLWSVPGKNRENLPSFNTTVNYASVSLDGATVAVSGFHSKANRYEVILRSLNGQTTDITVPLNEKGLPRAVALENAGKMLAVGIDLADGSKIQLFDTTTGTPRMVDSIHVPGPVGQLAFHPDGKTLAFTEAATDAVTVWDIDKKRKLDVVESNGRRPIDVAFSQDGKSFGFRETESSKQWKAFDLSVKNWAKKSAASFQPVAPADKLNGWEIHHDAGDPTDVKWDLKHLPTNESRRVPINPEIDFFPTCFTFLENEEKESGTRLLVGHTWGASLFRLSPGGEPKLLRKFVGHQGEVRALGVSQDGKRLITAGRDRTIGVWSLEPWPNQRELGADFAVQDAELVVSNVAHGSPAWEAKLEPGDVIYKLFYDAQEVRDGPTAWLQILKDPVPGKELVFYSRRAGEDRVSLTTVRQRPLWRFFSATNDEWILWRWQDYYYDCSTKGDDLIGWQINEEVDRTPRFVAAEQYRLKFHRPDKITEILGGERPKPERVSEEKLLPPQIRLAATDNGNGKWLLSLKDVSSEKMLASKPEEICLWINDHKYERWSGEDSDFSKTVEIDADELRRGQNYLVAQAHAGNGGRGDSKPIWITLEPSKTEKRRKPRVFGICVGVDDYSKAPKTKDGVEWNDLILCREDSEAMRDALLKQSNNDDFGKAAVIAVNDLEASRTKIVEMFRKLVGFVKPDDLFVLFLAGHGWAEKISESNKEYDPTTFAFVTPYFDTQKPRSTGITFLGTSSGRISDHESSMYDLMTQLPCHKFIILDCCHSGSVLGKETNILRTLVPERIGPVVMAACDKDEESWPIPTKGHGAFTAAILDALGESFASADQNADGFLSIDEMTHWVVEAVPKLIEASRSELRHGGLADTQSQHPQVFIPDWRAQELRFLKTSGASP